MAAVRQRATLRGEPGRARASPEVSSHEPCGCSQGLLRKLRPAPQGRVRRRGRPGRAGLCGPRAGPCTHPRVRRGRRDLRPGRSAGPSVQPGHGLGGAAPGHGRRPPADPPLPAARRPVRRRRGRTAPAARRHLRHQRQRLPDPRPELRRAAVAVALAERALHLVPAAGERPGRRRPDHHGAGQRQGAHRSGARRALRRVGGRGGDRGGLGVPDSPDPASHRRGDRPDGHPRQSRPAAAARGPHPRVPVRRGDRHRSRQAGRAFGRGRGLGTAAGQRPILPPAISAV